MTTTLSPWSARATDYASSTPHKFGPSLPKLVTLARPGPGDICLDIGTGAGHTAAQLARHAHKVYGLDPAEGMRQAATKTYGHLSNLEFVDGTSEQTGFPANTFDIITARHTLHHHPNIPATLTELKRVLKPGGRLVIVDEITPDAEVDVWYNQLERERDTTHKRAYLLSEWREFISQAKLEWIVGDAETIYTINVNSWLARMKLGLEQQQHIRQLFHRADEHTKQTLNIIFSNSEAVTFDMPMALILASKPNKKDGRWGVGGG